MNPNIGTLIHNRFNEMDIKVANETQGLAVAIQLSAGKTMVCLKVKRCLGFSDRPITQLLKKSGHKFIEEIE